ncbi:hypothetical protein ACFV1N_28525 [Streptosporangium canum]|uniref:hypothetical protein n=1 Tax=Streptosporangium canum TaxID=324952 RepID=UPI0036CFBB4A
MKTTTRKDKSGSEIRYLHLAHSACDSAAGRSVPTILHSFGREDQLDRDAIKRLVASLSKLLEPADALTTTTADTDLVFLESRPYGGTFVLDQLWHRLNIPATITKLDRPRRGRPRDTTVTERVLSVLVAGRVLAPSSKLAAADWISHDVHIDGLPEIGEQACYRARDWLHAVKD